MHFIDRLIAAIKAKRNPIVVGLDPRPESLPPPVIESTKGPPTGWLEGIELDDIARTAAAYEFFCAGVIDVIAPLVPAVKIQSAFFEQLGPSGIAIVGDIVRYAVQKDLIVIFDGKRNDIGSTAQAYADAYLGPRNSDLWRCDALTVNPYLGDDSLTPFIDTAKARGAGVFVLVKTSNPGGKRFQDLVAEGKPLYRHVADYVESLAAQTIGPSGYGLVGAVVGATYPQQLAELRQAMPHSWFLIPGYGAQGASAKDCAPAFDDRGLGAIVNSSRGIIFAHSRPEYKDRFASNNWQAAVELATKDMIEQIRAETTASRL